MSLFDAYEIIKGIMPTTDHFFGAEHIAGAHSKSRVVWVPSEDEIDAPMQIGQNPKAVYNRSAGADLWIFGIVLGGTKEDEYKATEALLHEVLIALHSEFSGSLDFERVRWGFREAGQWTTFGGACVLPIFVGVPVVEKQRPNVTIRAMEPIVTEVLPPS